MMSGTECAGASGSLHQPQANSAQGAFASGPPAGAQLGGLDLMAILQNAGVHPMPQPQPQPGAKQEPPSSIQVSSSLDPQATLSPFRAALWQTGGETSQGGPACALLPGDEITVEFMQAAGSALFHMHAVPLVERCRRGSNMLLSKRPVKVWPQKCDSNPDAVL